MKYDKETLDRYINIDNMPYDKIGTLYGVTGAAIRKAAKKLNINMPNRREINPSETFNKGRNKSEEGICPVCGKRTKYYSSGNNKFCSHKCLIEYKQNEYISEWKRGENNGMSGEFALSKYVRRYIMDKNNYSCEICGCNDVNPYTGKSILQIHHKDGNPCNCSEDNLQLLCPNCHSKTENYGSRNKNGNHFRTLYYNRADKNIDKP